MAEFARMKYDVTVIGLGGIGSAVLAHCASRASAVLGLDRFARGHDLGASSGKSRIIRKAYFEDPAYVPLVLRAYELWHELEQKSGEVLLRKTGVLAAGKEESRIMQGIRRAAREHDLPLDSLGKSEIGKRYPSLRLLPDEVAILEPDGGVLDPERATRAHLEIAEAAGAELRFETGIESWEPIDNGLVLHLSDGRRVATDKLVLALGPWFQETLRSLGVSLRVQRNVQVWFAPKTQAYAAPGFPAFLLDRSELPAPLYGFPDFGEGVKAAFHGFGELTDPEHLERSVDLHWDIEPLIAAMEDWMPGAAGTLLEAKPCMYSLTPDANFVIDRHPENANVVLCGGFSGHGFKFAPVIGEIAADLLFDDGTRHQIGFLSLSRFRNTTP